MISLSWEKESVLVLVKAAPNWSKKYREYQICTAGISQEHGWRRLYPFPEEVMLQKDIRLWDIIEVETKPSTDDPRPESRKIRAESIKKIYRIEDKEERRKFLERISEPSLEIPLKEKRTMTLIRPKIEAFKIKREIAEIVQITLNGKVFKRNPYGDVGLYYKWCCPRYCQICKKRPHNMRCFDWGVNILYRRYKDEKEAKIKTTKKCFYGMKYDNDTWFALGTHSQRPWKKWMIVGLLWMKKKEERTNNLLLTTTQ